MKKFLLSISLVLLCVCLVGCSNAQEDLAAKLDAHLNRLNSTISSVQDIRNADITYQSTTYQTPSSNRLNNPVVRENTNQENEIAPLNSSNNIDSTIYDDVLETNDCLGSCKSQIFELIEMLRTLSTKVKKNQIKLNDNQITGVNELLSNLAVNTNRISMSKNETNTEVGKVKAMLKDTNRNQAALNSRFIRLNNCLETRLTYYKNCLNVLNQIRVLLACENGNCTYENGKVCIDGTCYEDTELSKYGDNKEQTNEQSNVINNENDLKLFEEFKNYLERTRKENEIKNQELVQDEKRIENNNQSNKDTMNSNMNSSTTVNDRNNIKNDEINETNDIEQKTTNTQIEKQNSNENDTENKDIIISNNQTNSYENRRRGNIDTFRDQTVKRNIDSFRRINGKIASPSQLFAEWINMQKPFPEKITETNIIILSRDDTDKQFVENTNVESSTQEDIA